MSYDFSSFCFQSKGTNEKISEYMLPDPSPEKITIA